ncbi:MAG: hypothetical protein AAF899_05150 [Pseudomonadota bacterium]
MTERWLALCVATALLPQAAMADRGDGKGWVALLEVCAQYVETGRRAVFDDWSIAFDGGGVCNGDPACERPTMTFIPGQGRGAVTVATDQPAVGDVPGAATCYSVFGHPFVPSTVGGAHINWVSEALAAGRLYRSGGSDDLYGCAFDGRRFTLDARMDSLAYFEFDLPADAPVCQRGVVSQAGGTTEGARGPSAAAAARAPAHTTLSDDGGSA